jgi:hypothetical protein
MSRKPPSTESLIGLGRRKFRGARCPTLSNNDACLSTLEKEHDNEKPNATLGEIIRDRAMKGEAYRQQSRRKLPEIKVLHHLNQACLIL